MSRGHVGGGLEVSWRDLYCRSLGSAKGSKSELEVLSAVMSWPLRLLPERQLDPGHPRESWKFVFDDVPNNVQVDAEVGVHGSISETGDVGPGDLGVRRLSSGERRWVDSARV